MYDRTERNSPPWSVSVVRCCWPWARRPRPSRAWAVGQSVGADACIPVPLSRTGTAYIRRRIDVRRVISYKRKSTRKYILYRNMSGIANTGYVNTGYNLYTSGIQHPAWSEGTVLGIILDIIIGYNSYGVRCISRSHVRDKLVRCRAKTHQVRAEDVQDTVS